MKKLFYIPLALVIAGCGPTADKKPELKEQQDKVSYVIGRDIGSNMKRQGLELNADAFSYGVKTGISGETSLMTDEEIRTVMTAFQQEMQKKQQEVMQKQMQEQNVQGQKNAADGEKFLADNQKKEGVKTTASGLQYKVLKAGKGAKPKLSDTVVAHYRGTLVDGTEFDSSYKHGQAIPFPVAGVIPGWTEALQLMTAGSKWQLFIPSKLAYGPSGQGRVIGPNSTLIFEIELLEIKKKK